MTGTCRFCGQTMMTQCDIQEAADEVATENCKCEAGRNYRNIEAMKVEAKQNIDGLFEDTVEPIKEILYKAVDAIASDDCDQVTVKINNRVKATVSAGKDGVRVARSYSENNTIEAKCF